MISFGISRSDVLGNGPGYPVRAFGRDHAPEGMFGIVPNNIAAPTAVYARSGPKSCEKVNARRVATHVSTVVRTSFSAATTHVSLHHTAGRWLVPRSNQRPLPSIGDAEGGNKTFAGTVCERNGYETSEEGIEMMMNGTSTARIPKGMDAGRSHDRV